MDNKEYSHNLNLSESKKLGDNYVERLKKTDPEIARQIEDDEFKLECRTMIKKIIHDMNNEKNVNYISSLIKLGYNHEYRWFTPMFVGVIIGIVLRSIPYFTIYNNLYKITNQ